MSRKKAIAFAGKLANGLRSWAVACVGDRVDLVDPVDCIVNRVIPVNKVNTVPPSSDYAAIAKLASHNFATKLQHQTREIAQIKAQSAVCWTSVIILVCHSSAASWSPSSR